MLSKFNRLLPRLSTLAKQTRANFATKLGSTDLSKQNTNAGVVRRDRLQFSKDKLTDFGDLPAGEVPEALKYDRPVETSRLPNGIQVATQHWPGQLATISVFIKCGSRQETLENSGVAHFLEHLHFKGTKNRSRSQLELDVENMGGQLNAYTSRENTSYTMTVFKNDTSKAVEILGDMLSNSLYDKNQIEAERETIYRECIETQKDQMETTIEAAHYTSFRDHMMGQPILGIRENIGTITQDQIVDYHKTHYVGSNIVVVGAGDISHQQLTELTERHFGGLPSAIPSGLEVKNADQPYFTPSLMYMRDDEMANINVGVFFQAPSWTHEDYYSMLLYQRILGEYQQDKNGAAHLNHSERQYNTIHGILGQLPDLQIHKTIYAPYSDTGLFGSYLHGNEVHAYQMLYVSQMVLSDFANYLNQVEVFRAKNKLYNELLQHETGNDITQSIGNQLLYLNRVVPRSEIATRVSNIEQQHLSRVARNWFFDNEVSVVAWGPIHELMALSHYNRPIRRSTLGWYGDSALYIH
jgi:processing peptidase subunit beta